MSGNKIAYGAYKVVVNASPSSKLETNRVFKLLRAGLVSVLVNERKKKLNTAS